MDNEYTCTLLVTDNRALLQALTGRLGTPPPTSMDLFLHVMFGPADNSKKNPESAGEARRRFNCGWADDGDAWQDLISATHDWLVYSSR
jgi:hypothetical protein